MNFRPFQKIKPVLPKSLFGRFIIILLVPLLMVQIVLSYVFFERHTDTVIRLLSDTIAGDVALVKDMVEDGKNLSRTKQFAGQHLKLDVTLKKGEILNEIGQAKDTWLYDHMAKALETQLNAPFFLRMNKDSIFIDVASSKGVVQIKTERKRLYSKTTPYVLMWTTSSAALLFVVALLFMRNQIKPIRRLADAAEKFGKGQQIVAFKPEGATEVRKAAQAFNQMRLRILRFVEERTLQLAGISHDLRTPLTRMQLQLALMPQDESVENLQNDVDQMSHMIQGFLDYARGGMDEVSTPVKIRGLIKKIVEDFKRAHPFPIDYIFEGDAEILLKKHLFNRMLTNVLLNSAKYASKAMLTLSVFPSSVDIIIDDDGPGIPADKFEAVFQPFMRLDPARNSEMGGVGLGLTIVRDVMHMHGGRVSLAKSELGGLRVALSLPR